MTARKNFSHDVAKRSLAEIAEYLAREATLEIALRFLDRAEETFEFLLETPGIGHRPDFRALALGDVRAWAVRDFPNFLVYYVETIDGIVVLDVIHAARDQEERLRERFSAPH